jgi:hypothetical protein
MDSQPISLVDIVALMKATNPDYNSLWVTNDANGVYNKMILCNLEKLQQAVDKATRLNTDKLWLAYLNQLKSNLSKQIDVHNDSEKSPESKNT